MKVHITESQLKYITENYRDSPIIGMKVVDDELVIRYKDLEGNVVDDSYDQFTEEYETSFIEDYFLSKNLTLGNSGVVRWIIRQDPNNSDYSKFLRNENGRPYPEYFIGNYTRSYGGYKDERNRMIRQIRNVINFIYDSQYPITVYRGLNPKHPKYREGLHKGNYWTLKKSVAYGFGDDIYVGLIKSPEDISLGLTIQGRMTWPEEYEIYLSNPENVEIIGQLKRK
jgi:hypothetical protein